MSSAAIAREQDEPDVWRPQVRPELRVEVIEREAIALDQARDRVHHLNEVAAFVLQRCTGQMTEQQIVALVVKHYDVEDALAANDIAQLLRQLRALEILI